MKGVVTAPLVLQSAPKLVLSLTRKSIINHRKYNKLKANQGDNLNEEERQAMHPYFKFNSSGEEQKPLSQQQAVESSREREVQIVGLYFFHFHC